MERKNSPGKSSRNADQGRSTENQRSEFRKPKQKPRGEQSFRPTERSPEKDSSFYKQDKREGKDRNTDSKKSTGRKPEFEHKKGFEKSHKGSDKKFAFQKKEFKRTSGTESKQTRSKADEGTVRLNKYIANSGICSRREADELIRAGVVMVNGKVVTTLGTKVSPGDKVQYDNQLIKSEKLVYLLLNKPKGYITTTDDPFDRKTVMALVDNACKERIYPVGRLDRNTTGLLLLTNDGELAKKLTHPKHNVRKVYHVELDKSLSRNDMLKIADGVELEDGKAMIDEIAYVGEGSNKREIGVELHSGKNRIVRRIFEAVGYEVVKLDRVVFAGLTKKDLPRGQWRFLTEQEVNFLKMLR